MAMKKQGGKRMKIPPNQQKDTDLFDNLEIYRSHYFHEVERKDQIQSALSLPVGLVVAAVGVIGYFVEHFYFLDNYTTLIFIVLLAISSGFLVLTAYRLFRVTRGYVYRYLPAPKELYDYHGVLNEHYRSTLKKNESSADMRQLLCERYAASASHNAEMNDSKSAYLAGAMRSLFLLLIALGFATPFYLYTAVRYSPSPSLQAAAENGPLSSLRDDVRGFFTMKTNEPPIQKPEPAKPAPPPDRFVKEDKQPRKTR